MFDFDLIRGIFEDDYFMANRRGPIPWTIKTKRTEEGMELKMAVPGCTEEDVSVEVGSDLLAIEAEVMGTKISRTYIVPSGSDVDGIKAEVKEGLLTVTIPKGKRRKLL